MADINSAMPIRTESDADAKVQIKIVDATTPSQQATVDANGDVGTKAKIVDEAGASFSGANPLPVSFTPVAADTCELDQNTAAAIVKLVGTASHTFSPAANSSLQELHLASSGLVKFEISVGVALSEVLKFVHFTTPSERSKYIKLDCPIAVLSTDNVLIEMTNLDNQDMDIYSTIQVVND